MKKNILLIHGWDYNLYTNMTKNKDAWNNYKDFISMLEKKYNIYKLNLPGFCGEKEPNKKEWNIHDYSKYINNYIEKNNIKIDLIIGYSFGGAIALDYKTNYNLDSKLFLIAPAIIRNMNIPTNTKVIVIAFNRLLTILFGSTLYISFEELIIE